LEAETTSLLFVYGSLMSGGERGNFLNRDHKVRFLGPATAQGTLYDFGGFVGLTDEVKAAPVHGELYEVIDEETFFATLDLIEGYSPAQPQRSLYVRKHIPVQTATAIVQAWAYLYNQPVNDFPIITSGDYLQYRSNQSPVKP
jgi:gamma-glutamylcyclotransferase (GGCT)/AIG2-like uncharacterized protein YtfP